jgi:hypothetical protein
MLGRAGGKTGEIRQRRKPGLRNSELLFCLSMSNSLLNGYRCPNLCLDPVIY